MSKGNELSDAVKRSLERYFKDMDGETPTSIYEMVLKNIDNPKYVFTTSAPDTLEVNADGTTAKWVVDASGKVLRKISQGRGGEQHVCHREERAQATLGAEPAEDTEVQPEQLHVTGRMLHNRAGWIVR